MSYEQSSALPEGLYVYYVGDGAEVDANIETAATSWNGLSGEACATSVPQEHAFLQQPPEQPDESAEFAFDLREQAALDETQTILNLHVYVSLLQSQEAAAKDKPGDLAVLQTKRMLESLGREATAENIAAAHLARHFIYMELPEVSFEAHAGLVYNRRYVEQNYPAPDFFEDALVLRDETIPEVNIAAKIETFLSMAVQDPERQNLARAIAYSTVAQVGYWKRHEAFKQEVFHTGNQEIEALVAALLAQSGPNT